MKNFVKIEPTPFNWGTYGAIFRGEEIDTRDQVIVKVENTSGFERQRESGFLEREYGVMVELNHPNIAKVKDLSYSSPISSPERSPFFLPESGNRTTWFDELKVAEDQSKKMLFLTVEYVDGETLCDRIFFSETKEPLATTQVVDIITQIASAVDYLDSKGIYHRDLDPKNIMLTPEGKPILIDFGFSNKVSEPDMDGKSITNLNYPPESTDPNKHDVRSEVFVLGQLAWQVLNAEPPFLSAQHWKDGDENNIKPFKDTNNRGLSEVQVADLNILFQETFDVDPDKRPKNATEFANRLKNILIT